MLCNEASVLGGTSLDMIDMRAIVLVFSLMGMLSVNADNNKNQLQIVTTIKPIQALVFAIIDDVDIAQSQQLIPDFASPHHYSFKPSDIRKIKKADIIFRIDEQFEMMLNPSFAHAQDKNTPIISLADALGISLLPSSKKHRAEHGVIHNTTEESKHSSEHSSEHSLNGHHKEQQTKQHNEHDERNEHSEHNLDMHIWTSPDNAIAMAKQITRSLSQINPENKTQYEENLQHLLGKIKTSIKKTKAQLKTVQQSPYIVFHDSWQYFGHYFSLNKPTVVNFHEGISVGAKTIHNVRKKIKSKNIHCVFSSTGLNPARIIALTENMQNVKTVEIDVLARTLPINKDTYVNWLNTMGQQIKHCLTEN